MYYCMEPECAGAKPLHPGGSTKPLWNHHESKHPRIYQELKGYHTETIDGGASTTDGAQRTITSPAPGVAVTTLMRRAERRE